MASKIVQKIVEGATDLFAKQGYFGTTTRDIALRADVTEPSIYRLFLTKERLFQECLTAVIAKSLEPSEFQEIISDHSEGDFASRVTRAVRRWYTSFSAQSARLLMQAALSDNNAWGEMAYSRLKEIITILAKGIERETGSRHSSAVMAARMLILALFQFKVARPMLGSQDLERDAVDKTVAQWLQLLPH